MINDFIDKAARLHADLHFIDEALAYLDKPWDKAKARYAKTLADFAKFCIRHKWICVDDKLPENDGYVLVYVNGDSSFGTPDRYEIAYYDTEDWYSQNGEHIRPSYWCDIPQLNLENTTNNPINYDKRNFRKESDYPWQ